MKRAPHKLFETGKVYTTVESVPPKGSRLTQEKNGLKGAPGAGESAVSLSVAEEGAPEGALRIDALENTHFQLKVCLQESDIKPPTTMQYPWVKYCRYHYNLLNIKWVNVLDQHLFPSL